jgi:hypothetical protein
MSPDDAYQGEIAEASRAPGGLVFLCGPQRSGTTLLHRLLVNSGVFRFVSAYDIWSYESLLHDHRSSTARTRRGHLADIIRQHGQGDRGIDTIPVGADAPEEYGLVLSRGRLRMGCPDLTPCTLPGLHMLLGKKALIDATDRPLLLKNPPDYPAMSFVTASFPAAHFVVLHRHPLAVLRSQMRAWCNALRRRNPYLALLDLFYDELFLDQKKKIGMELALRSLAGVEWLAWQLLTAHKAYLDLMGTRAGVLDVRYEDLVATPRCVLNAIGRFLAVDACWPTSLPPGRRPSEPLALIDAAYEKHIAQFRPYLRRFDYDATPLAEGAP